MNQRIKPSGMLPLIACFAALLFFAVGGCEEDYVMAGDFMTPTVEPMDFSPYGYDYSLYDVLTEE